MGFAWHKLIPRRNSGTLNCPPPVCSGDTVSGSMQITFCPTCNQFPCLCSLGNWNGNVSGTNCGGQDVVPPTGIVVNPGCPKEMRMSGFLPCTWSNTESQLPSGVTSCNLDTTAPIIPYYYRTPSSTTSIPSSYSFGAYCLKFNAYDIPDRVMVISGRNRYRYGGWASSPACNGGIPRLWDAPGASGLSQMEGMRGQQFPLPDSILGLPLFGANSQQNPERPCSESNGSPCLDTGCFSCRENSGTGHYLPADQGNGKGYFSFQCFNPQSYVFDSWEPDSNKQWTPVPTCSVWALVHSIWKRVIDAGAYANGWTEAQTITEWSTAYSALTTLLNADPSGTSNQTSNVRVYLEDFANALVTAGTGIQFRIPNVFLWDKDNFNAASNTDKWKHLYVVGNSNVIFDSGCIKTSNGAIGSVFFLDEVGHDPTPGSTAAARILQFHGCSANASGNGGSNSQLSVTLLDCVPNSPKNPTWCAVCENEDNTTTQNCYYYGNSPYNNYPIGEC